jgi:hypothetical protein
MAQAPKADPPRCDVPGCGTLAEMMTDGTEKDPTPLNRPAIKNLNVCAHHHGWPFSDDAQRFAADPASPYRSRK